MIYFWFSLQKPFFKAYKKGIDGRKAKGGEQCQTLCRCGFKVNLHTYTQYVPGSI